MSGGAGGESRGRDAANRGPVKVVARQALEHLRPVLLLVGEPRLDQQFLDARMVLVGPLLAGTGNRYRCHEVFNHVAHALIIGDRPPVCQVMRGMSLTQA